MEWFLEVNSLILTIFGVGFFGLLTQFFKWIRKHAKIKEIARQEEKDLVNRRLVGLEKANVAILHNKIYRQCDEHLSDGFITIDDLDDLSYLFNAYKALGGNGTGEVLYNKVKELPNRKEVKQR